MLKFSHAESQDFETVKQSVYAEFKRNMELPHAEENIERTTFRSKLRQGLEMKPDAVNGRRSRKSRRLSGSAGSGSDSDSSEKKNNTDEPWWKQEADKLAEEE